jgi:dolichol kinase
MSDTDQQSSRETPTETTAADIDRLREQFSRTPRPYLLEGQEVLQDGTQIRNKLDAPTQVNGLEESLEQPNGLSINSSSAKNAHDRSRQPSRPGSESGSEADDERPTLVKALPPSVVRPRKGLKTGEEDEDALLTPSQLDDEGRRLPDNVEEQGYAINFPPKNEDAEELEVLRRRRLAEFLRRLSEVALMTAIVLVVLCGRGVARVAWQWSLEIFTHMLIVTALIVAYPLKLSIVDEHARPEKLWQRFRVPASFDPATVLYPPLLPLLVALSVAPLNAAVILPNIILGLSALPQRLFPRSTRLGGINAVHWLISVIPLIVSTHVASPKRSTTTSIAPLSAETLVSLYPLHNALLSPLHYLTTTSLLISELHLLSATLINLLLLAASPQAVILKSCLWIGGVIFFVLCGPVLNWNITLARVPKWKLRRPGHGTEDRKSLVDTVTELINLQRATSAFRAATTDRAVDSDADEDEPKISMKLKARPIARRINTTILYPLYDTLTHGPLSAVEDRSTTRSTRPRSSTVPELDLRASLGIGSTPTRSKSKASRAHWYLQLTPDQAFRRKWFYAGFTYVCVVIAILGPVRSYITYRSLAEQEPIGWALGYMFGQVTMVRTFVEALGIEAWAFLPRPAGDWKTFLQHFQTLPLDIEAIRDVLGASNVRLLLLVYWAGVLLVGLLVVFSLSAYVEVDTRRKVFHGVMVAMLSPTIFIDPCYCALALALVLTVFLLLEAIRAGQIPPLGSAISRFVAPYVDGRDLRGPVVVSHIFLLIGCAVPLWFSLASLPRAGGLPWVGWEVGDGTRETAMVAGVICVGMGDAAASLIGRRYGRHKWLWVGGKSLEGSAAFAAAVTIGLMAVKTWLVLGGWRDGGRPIAGSTLRENLFGWTFTLLKAIFCACGASFMEAVLTGANDNVVVPIALWLLVKGTRL